MMQLEMDYQILKDGWLNVEKDLKVQELKTDKIVPLRTLQQTCDILHQIISEDKYFNNLLDIETNLYDKL
jgi:hypothetical protein